MSTLTEKANTLANTWPSIRIITDASIQYVYIPNLKITCKGEDVVVEALLCPSKHGGYMTRLFISKPLTQACKNWTQHAICGKTWHTWSWQGIPETLDLMQMILGHVRALR